jgi:hypothetical protein
MLQRLVAATTPAAAAAPDAAPLPGGKTPKKGKKQPAAAAAAVPDAAAAAAVAPDEAEWLPDLMAALCEQVRRRTKFSWGWLRVGVMCVVCSFCTCVLYWNCNAGKTCALLITAGMCVSAHVRCECLAVVWLLFQSIVAAGGW